MTARDRSRCTLPNADSTLRIRGTRHTPRRRIRPLVAAIVDVVPAFCCGSEARADTSSVSVLAVTLGRAFVHLLARDVLFGVCLLQALHGRVAVDFADQ
jgi:hypothetical protein